MNKKSLLLLIPFAVAGLAGCTPVTPPAPPTPQCGQVEVSFSETSFSIGVGETAKLPFTTAAACDGLFTVASSNEEVATVDGAGKVTGHKEGEATITINGKTITVYVTGAVDPEVAEVKEVKSHPESVKQNGSINPSDVTLVVIMSDGTEADKKATKVDCDTSKVGTATATAYYGEVGNATFEIEVVAVAPSTMEEAYTAAAALPDGGETEEFTFGGVVVATRTASKEYFIQDGEYGVDIYNPVDASLLTVGKKVKITTTLQNYKGLVETKTISKIEADGEGSVPAAVKVVSEAYLTILNTNVLVDSDVIVTSKPKYDETKDLSLEVLLGSDTIKVFFKKSILSKWKSFIESLYDNCSISLKNAIVGSYNTKQFVVADDTEITKGADPERELVSVSIEGTATKTNYYAGDKYNSDGLYVVAHYDDETSNKVSATITPAKEKAELGDTSIKFSVTYQGKSADKDVAVTVTEKPAPTGESSVYTFNNTWGETKNFTNINESEFLSILEVDGDEVITGYKDATNAYIGGNGKDTDGTDWKILNSLKVGKSGAQGTITLKLDSSIVFDSIKVKAIGNRDDGTLTLNSVTKDVAKKAVKTDLEPIEVEFDIKGGIEELVISSKNITSSNYSILITSIEFVGGGSPTPVTPEVKTVTVSPKSAEIEVGSTKTLSVDVQTAGGAAKTVAWTSSDESVATVDTNGVVTAVAEGDATITVASTVDGFADKKDTCAIHVIPKADPEVVSVAVSPKTATVTVDSTTTLTATVDTKGGAAKTVAWTSSDESVATVDANGVVTGVAAGTATITATSTVVGFTDKSDSCVVTVNEKPAPGVVNVEYDFAGLKKNDADALTEETALSIFASKVSLGSSIIEKVTPTKAYTNIDALRVGSSNATSGQGALAFTLSSNITEIVITAHGYKSDELNDITVGSETVTVEESSKEFSFKVESTKSITIETSKRVLIDKIGFVAESVVPVVPTVESVTVTPKEADVGFGKTRQLEAEVAVTGGASTAVTWEVVDAVPTDCVTVDEHGLITAGSSAGTAKVVATSVADNTKSDFCTVTVTDDPTPAEKGTVDNPYTSAEAVAIAAELESGGCTSDSYYIKGVVESFEESFSPSFGNYSFKMVDGFIAWRLKNGASYAKFNDGDIEIGDEVVIYAQIQKYGAEDKPESKGGYVYSVTKAPAKEIVSITSVDAPAEISKNATLAVSSVDVTVEYSDHTSGVVHPDSIDLVTSVVADGVTGTVHVGVLADTFTINVVESSPDTPVELTTTTNALVEKNSWTVSTNDAKVPYTEFDLDDVISVSTTGTNDCGTVWGTDSKDWRLYQTGAGNVTFTAASGYKIVSISITYGNKNNGVAMNGGTQVASGSVVNVDDTSITLTVGNTGSATNGQVRITSWTVVYVAI